MKKILSIILTLTMLLAISAASVSAATAIDGGEGTSSTGNGGGDYTVGVAGEVAPDPNSDATISFEISWDRSQFTYVAPSSGKWNAEDHVYEGATAGGWDQTPMNITVKNHSDTGIVASFTFAEGDVTGVKGAFTEDYLPLLSADNDSYRQQTNEGTYPAPTAATAFTIDSTSPAITGDVTGLGTITVAVKQALVAGNENYLEAMLSKIGGGTGGTVYLANDITLTSTFAYYRTWWGAAQNPVVIDLAGHTINGNIWVNGATSGTNEVVIQNGTINYDLPDTYTEAQHCVAVWAGSGAKLTLKNVTVSGTDTLPLYIDSGASAVLCDSNLKSTLKQDAFSALDPDGATDISVYLAGEITLDTAKAGRHNGVDGYIDGRFLFSDDTREISVNAGAVYHVFTIYHTISVEGGDSGRTIDVNSNSYSGIIAVDQ